MKPPFCRNFISGTCHFGKRCKFNHVKPEDIWQQRQWTHAPGASSAQHLDDGGQQHHHHLQLRVMSYNVLADGLAYEHRQELYRYAPPHQLEWRWRCGLLLREVAHWRPDVLALQEVDQFGQLQALLRPLGYDGVYAPRTGDRYDGCATFWRRDALALERSEVVHMRPLGLRDNVALFLTLRPLLSAGGGQGGGGGGGGGPGGNGGDGKRQRQQQQQQQQQQAAEPTGVGGEASPARFVFANTHILFNPKRGDIKLGQVRTILATLARLQCEAGGERACPLLLCGDFNSLPGSALYRLLAEGRLDCGGVDRRSVSGQVEGRGWTWYQQQRRNGAGLAPFGLGHGAGGWPFVGHARSGGGAPSPVAAAMAGAPNHQQPPPLGHGASAMRHGLFAPGFIPASATAAHHQPPPQQPHGMVPMPVTQPLPPHHQPPPQQHSWMMPPGAAAEGHPPLPQQQHQQQQQQQHWWGQGGAPAAAAAAATAASMRHTWSAQDLRNATGASTAASATATAAAAAAAAAVQRGGRQAPPLHLLPEDPAAWVLQHGLRLRSTYAAVCGGREPPFTSLHDRFIGPVDYIWFSSGGGGGSEGPRSHSSGDVGCSGNGGGSSSPQHSCSLEPMRVLQPPALDGLHVGFPSDMYPSDHVSLVADFRVVTTATTVT